MSPLHSSRTKINRANKHLADFQVLLDAFASRDPYRTVTDEHSEPAIKIFRVKIHEEIPAEFSGIIGDTVHNLMSALDSLAMSLVTHANIEPVTEEVMRETYFPIGWEPGFSGAKNARFFKRIGPAAEKIVRGLQPYKGGLHNDLFRLWRLDIIDKHRAIIPVAGDLASEAYTTIVEGEQVVIRDGKPVARRFPIKDGDEIARTVFHQREYYAHAHFAFQIAFAEGQIFEGDPVAPTLRQLLNLVEGVIDIFARDVFKTDW